jgi:hypothetical protein
VVTVEELETLFAVDHESRRMELKGAGLLRRNGRFVAKVARAAMAMGNLRDGGLVVLGIANDQIATMQPGLSDAELAEWSDFDLVSAALSRYSDPPVSFELHKVTLSNGARIVVLEVAEFEHDVHICKKDFEGVLQDGQTYVRPRGEPRSVPVPSSAEARELHNLAIDKGVREFVRRGGAAGILLGPVVVPGELDTRAYGEEVATAWATPNPVTQPDPGTLGAWVTLPGYTDVAVRPTAYQGDRMSPGALERFVVEHTVSMRGWPVPYVDNRVPIQRHGTWVAQDISSGGLPHGEAWRMFTSGQFLHRRLLATDLRDAQVLKPDAAGATGAVAVWDVLLYVVEVAEFGARMATALGLDQVTFDVALDGIAGRQLISGDFWRELDGPYIAAANRFDATKTVEVTTLLEDTRGVGVDLAQPLLQQFGLDVPDEVLFEWQDKTFNR